MRHRLSPPKGQGWVGWKQHPKGKWPRRREFRLYCYTGAQPRRVRITPEHFEELFPTLTWRELVASYRRAVPSVHDVTEFIEHLLEHEG